MAPFRNFLSKKSVVSNGGEADSAAGINRLSAENQRSNPLSVRKSCENAPNEYKLSGMLFITSISACYFSTTGDWVH